MTWRVNLAEIRRSGLTPTIIGMTVVADCFRFPPPGLGSAANYPKEYDDL